MTRSVRVLLEDILESIALIEAYTAALSYEGFRSDTVCQDAVIRRLEVIGQAVKALPSELREQNPQVPWREIAGTRDILSHEYFRVDLELVWDMTQHNVPALKESVEAILRAS